MNKVLIYITLSAALLISVGFSLSLGAMQIPLQETFRVLLKSIGIKGKLPIDSLNEGIILTIRMPRVLMGILVGAALGMCGAAIQGIFKNPLAEPGLIGISSGASLLAVLIIAFETLLFSGLSEMLGYYLLAFGAFAGAGIAALLVFHLSKTNGQVNVVTMLLVGIAINAIAGALTGLISYLANEQQLRSITFWMLGSLGGATWPNVRCLMPFVVIPILLLPLFSKGLNAFALGEKQAEMIGLNPGLTKAMVVLLSTMAVGASVSFTGIIGFVGLLVPHLVRIIGGVDHKFVLPASALLGAWVLTFSDLIARLVIQPIELPIGVVTALIGAPVFLYILIRDKKKLTH